MNLPNSAHPTDKFTWREDNVEVEERSDDGEPFVTYGRPQIELEIEPTPRLESWMRHDHPDQLRLRAYLDWLEPRLSPLLAPEGNALSLTVAVPAGVPLDTGGRDLDNYLLPIARRLGHARFVSAWAAKEHRERSMISVSPAQAAPAPDGSWQFAAAETAEPKASPAWKRDIEAQMRRQVHECASGPVELQISYMVAPRWNWTELWKPTIDALGAILGDGSRPFHPLDDRIVLLGLHRRAQHRAIQSTTLRVWWRPATRPGT